VTDAVTPATIFNLGLGFWASKTLLSAVELGVRPISPPYRVDSACMTARRAIFSTRLSR
jgi:hypothetical protein